MACESRKRGNGIDFSGIDSGMIFQHLWYKKETNRGNILVPRLLFRMVATTKHCTVHHDAAAGPRATTARIASRHTQTNAFKTFHVINTHRAQDTAVCEQCRTACTAETFDASLTTRGESGQSAHGT